jgi:hypothetical protein
VPARRVGRDGRREREEVADAGSGWGTPGCRGRGRRWQLSRVGATVGGLRNAALDEARAAKRARWAQARVRRRWQTGVGAHNVAYVHGNAKAGLSSGVRIGRRVIPNRNP